MLRVWNLWDLKSEAIREVKKCKTDIQLRDCIMYHQSRMIEKSVDIEQKRELYVSELAILSESAGWMNLCFDENGDYRYDQNN